MLFTIIYDSGCGDLVCRKLAIDKLITLGRANRVLPGPITLSGVGDKKTGCQEGVYKIMLPLSAGGNATMSGLCLDKVTGKFHKFSLKKVEDDIRGHYRKCGKDPGNLPRLPYSVGGETDIMIGIKYLKYFPKEVHQLPNGLTLYKTLFENFNGSHGVVGARTSHLRMNGKNQGNLRTLTRLCQGLPSTRTCIKPVLRYPSWDGGNILRIPIMTVPIPPPLMMTWQFLQRVVKDKSDI